MKYFLLYLVKCFKLPLGAITLKSDELYLERSLEVKEKNPSAERVVERMPGVLSFNPEHPTTQMYCLKLEPAHH